MDCRDTAKSIDEALRSAGLDADVAADYDAGTLDEATLKRMNLNLIASGRLYQLSCGCVIRAINARHAVQWHGDEASVREYCALVTLIDGTRMVGPINFNGPALLLVGGVEIEKQCVERVEYDGSDDGVDFFNGVRV